MHTLRVKRTYLFKNVHHPRQKIAFKHGDNLFSDIKLTPNKQSIKALNRKQAFTNQQHKKTALSETQGRFSEKKRMFNQACSSAMDSLAITHSSLVGMTIAIGVLGLVITPFSPKRALALPVASSR